MQPGDIMIDCTNLLCDFQGEGKVVGELSHHTTNSNACVLDSKNLSSGDLCHSHNSSWPFNFSKRLLQKIKGT